MKIQKEIILFHPLTIFVLLLLAFLFASAPARAGGMPEDMNGVGGGPGIVSPVPTVMNKETLSNNTKATNDTETLMGTVISKDGNSLSLQTLNGRKNLSVNDDVVVRRDGKVTTLNNLENGDIVTVTTNRNGEVLGISKDNGMLGRIQNLLLLIGIAFTGAVIATSILKKSHRPATTSYQYRRYI